MAKVLPGSYSLKLAGYTGLDNKIGSVIIDSMGQGPGSCYSANPRDQHFYFMRLKDEIIFFQVINEGLNFSGSRRC